MKPSQSDRRLLAALENGLAIAPRPFAELARAAGMSESEVIDRLAALRSSGVIKRMGLVVRHHELGYQANAMVVWNVPDERIGEVGRMMASFPFVTLCYRRPRRSPNWPYNLFCMIHGRDRGEVETQARVLAETPALNGVPHELLFSRRRFKQRGARYVSLSRSPHLEMEGGA